MLLLTKATLLLLQAKRRRIFAAHPTLQSVVEVSSPAERSKRDHRAHPNGTLCLKLPRRDVLAEQFFSVPACRGLSVKKDTTQSETESLEERTTAPADF